ncbi:hypothetical protein E2C01_041954 [Portunus trituberculatus]|uniref:Uncharacterized protein n=1 Tax=Portunus trituberculatus TaxID=210409 RepID=A0A5B7FRR2_PORTR|nr:hypothetical protein [Portunus trituberculatus]
MACLSIALLIPPLTLSFSSLSLFSFEHITFPPPSHFSLAILSYHAPSFPAQRQPFRFWTSAAWSCGRSFTGKGQRLSCNVWWLTCPPPRPCSSPGTTTSIDSTTTIPAAESGEYETSDVCELGCVNVLGTE